MDAVLDSGASTSLIDPTLAATLGAKIQKASPLRLRFADSKSQITDQVAVVTICFRGQRREFKFRITPNLPYPCLCGIDFMKNFYVIITSTPKDRQRHDRGDVVGQDV